MDDPSDIPNLSIAELMSMPAIAIGPDARKAEVLALAATHAIHHFPILSGTQLIGLVCVSDLVTATPESEVIHWAWRHVVTAEPQCSPDDAARLMRLHDVDSVVVVDEGGVWGIVTREDLLEADPELLRLMRGA
jgi:CBS domain-containing protein